MRLASDPASLMRFRRLQHSSRSGDPVPVRLRDLGGTAMRLRPGTSDADVLVEVFVHRLHLPPVDDVRLIWDLGANIGLTMAHYAATFPEARVVGVELDGANAALCRSNVAPWADRTEVIEAAVWSSDGSVAYASEPGNEWAAHVEAGGAGSARAISLDTLAAGLDEGELVDFVKVDVEGAERELLTRNTEWASRVRSLTVEVHAPYTVDECGDDLAALGFTVREVAGHEHGLVTATR
jgi:FkbM family methyltransferase